MKDLETVKNKITLVDYISTTGVKLKNLGRGTFTINPCPVCGHKDHFRINSNENYYNSFSGCCKGGDILNYMQEVEHLSFKEAKEKLYKITNTPTESYNSKKPLSNIKRTYETRNDKKQTEQQLKDINDFILNGLNKMQDKNELIQYLNKRNISQNVVEKYHLFISNDKMGKKRLYIPIQENGKYTAYIGRILKDEKGVYRYNNSKGIIQPLNLNYLKEEVGEDKTIYICEGFFDAVSVEEQGKRAISLNSTQNIKKLIEAIKENIDTAKNYLYIIAMDTDEAGEKAKVELQKELTNLEIKNTYLDIPKKNGKQEKYNDINEWYCNVQRETFCELLEQSIYNKYSEKTDNYYIINNYLDEIQKHCKYPLRKTGFKKLDEELNGGIKNGLYIIGAIPSLGKTTLTLQIADNIASQGNKVIIFSLEQSRFELVSKSISRLTWETSPR